MTVYALYLENVLSLCFCSSCILYCSCINIHHVFCAQSMLHTVLKENESYFLDHLFFFLDHFFMSFVRITTENSENLKHEHGVICFLSCWYYGGSCFYWCMCHMFFMAHAAEVKDERFFSTILHAFPLSCPNHTTSCELMSTPTEPAEWCSHHPELLFSLRSLPGWTDHMRHTWRLMLNTGAKWPFHQSLMQSLTSGEWSSKVYELLQSQSILACWQWALECEGFCLLFKLPWKMK